MVFPWGTRIPQNMRSHASVVRKTTKPHDHSHPFVRLQSVFCSLSYRHYRSGQIATRQRRVVMESLHRFYRCKPPAILPKEKSLATRALGPHPFPSRTRSLSQAAPMVLRSRDRGRVGRCRHLFEAPVTDTVAGASSFSLPSSPIRIAKPRAAPRALGESLRSPDYLMCVI